MLVAIVITKIIDRILDSLMEGGVAIGIVRLALENLENMNVVIGSRHT